MIKASSKDKAIVTEILCQSFETNNSVNFVIKQDKNRLKRIRVLMEYSFDICDMFGQVYLSDDRNACALILLPDRKKTNLRTILLDIKLAFTCVGIKRLFKVLNRNSKIKNAYPFQSVFYLWFIGVKIAEQNKGIGGALLSELIKEGNLMQRPIYLETSMPENVAFYKKFGFEVYRELDFGHTLFLIRRDPDKV